MILPVVLLLLLSYCSPEENTIEKLDFSKVQVEGGVISGVLDSISGINVFKGIPYAEPPVGDLRWTAPIPVKPWDGILSCKEFRASPVQIFPEPIYVWSEEFLIPEEPISEDCLYLNIWTGAKSVKEKRPVVVWVHGGGFTSGSGSVPIYDGKAMAKKGVVFVNINYRLGVFGFLAHPELSQESPDHSSGNYGLMDQIAAIQWVKNNIAAFGGDPNKITISGQSAGSASVVFLSASPLTKGLFQQVIAQSGAGLLSRSPSSSPMALDYLQEAELHGKAIEKELGLSSIKEMREMDAFDLQDAVKGRFQPIVDGYVLEQSVTKTYLEGKAHPIKLLTGWNQDDGVVIGGYESAEDFRKRIENSWESNAGQLLEFYPSDQDSISAHSQRRLQRDIAFGAQNYTLAELIDQQGNDVFVYRFARKIPTGTGPEYGAFHTGEVPYAYENLSYVNRPFTEVDWNLADQMASYWANFIKTGNPNGDGLLKWPKYSTSNKNIIWLDKEIKQEVLKDSASLEFLRKELLSN